MIDITHANRVLAHQRKLMLRTAVTEMSDKIILCLLQAGEPAVGEALTTELLHEQLKRSAK